MKKLDAQEMTWVDVRHVTRDENVACGARDCTARWASYVLETTFNPNTMKAGKARTFLCRSHAQAFLVLSDAIAVD